MATQKRHHKVKEREDISPDIIAEMLELFWQMSPKERVRIVQQMKHVRTEVVHQHLQFTWAGSLKDFSGEFTSLDLQQKALEWRTQ